MFSIQPLDGPFGVEIVGLDLSKPVPEGDISRLVEIFHAHQVIRIPRQDITLADYARIGKWFGRPHPHIVEIGQVPGFEYISLLTNEAEIRRNTSAYWHTDNTYEAEPASATMLWAHTVPAQGGGTLVADMYSAYDDLPATMRKEIEGLKTLNTWAKNRKDLAEPPVGAARLAELGIYAHPLVLKHPVTGRKALYSITGSSFGIEGMPADEGSALLQELTQHATQQKYRLEIVYQKHDFAAWDTFSTLHAATPHADPTQHRDMLREMYRISVKGVSPYARKHPDAAA